MEADTLPEYLQNKGVSTDIVQVLKGTYILNDDRICL